MTSRFLILLVVVAGAIAALLWSATSASSKEVVTVGSLLKRQGTHEEIRLGARVAEGEFEYQTSPEFLLRFNVRDIQGAGATIPVVYHGVMPETLKQGRDVILEGSFSEGVFEASTLLTQCPSKYEPPAVPGAAPHS